jgi:hypothetical protein
VKQLTLLTVVLVVGLQAGQSPGALHLGGRIGIFSNSEEQLATGSDIVKLYANKNNIYVEASFAYYLLPPLAVVSYLGSYSKGDIRFDGFQTGIGYRTFFGSASVYPLQLGVKLSPFASQLPLRLQPFVEGGGALIIGSESINSLYYDRYRDAWVDGSIETETDWNWWLGCGAEAPLSKKVYLDFVGKYINVNFSGDIAGIRDYSGWQITFGFGYLILSK